MKPVMADRVPLPAVEPTGFSTLILRFKILVGTDNGRSTWPRGFSFYVVLSMFLFSSTLSALVGALSSFMVIMTCIYLSTVILLTSTRADHLLDKINAPGISV
jgi:hypothetical protein